MALLKPNPNQEKTKFSVKIGTNSANEINAYCGIAPIKPDHLTCHLLPNKLPWRKHFETLVWG